MAPTTRRKFTAGFKAQVRVLRLSGGCLRVAIPEGSEAVFTRHFPEFYTL